MAREGKLSEWGSVISISQWAGRGRFHRRWASPEGGLYGALILPQLTDEWERIAPLMTGYILSECLSERGWETLLKWPNDILAGNKKCGGVLIEQKNNFFAAGIGLNLNRKEDEIIKKEPGSFSPGYLAGEDEEPVSVLSLWEFLVKNFKKKYYEIVGKLDSEVFFQKIVSRFAFRESDITLKLPSGRICRGFMAGIDPTGALKVVVDGKEETFLNAEILPEH
jgi:BirA family biotin operon repressor/biotin-[acetyl-CoA-carboxylase] ligase